MADCKCVTNPNSTTGPQKRILCVGKCSVDMVNVFDEFPVEDSTTPGLAGYWQRGGNASNNCTVLRQLGVEQVEFLGTITTAPAFAFLADDFRQRGILIDHCPNIPNDPPLSTVLVNQSNGSRTTILTNADFPTLTHQNFRQLKLSDYCWIHFEGINAEETMRMLRDVATYNKTHKPAEQIKVSLDLDDSNPELLKLAELVHYVFLSKALAEKLGGTEVEQAMQDFMGKLTAQTKLGLQKPGIICTWDPDGSGCMDNQGHSAVMPPEPVAKVEDSLGVRDTFCAATIYALAKCDANLPTAVTFGNTVAGYKQGYRGYDAISEFKEQPVNCDWPPPKSAQTTQTTAGLECRCLEEDNS